MKEVMMKLSELVFDEKLLRFRPINTYYVSRYRQAYRAGKSMGDIIIDKKTKRIVSGNSRVTSLLEEYGSDHEIIVFPVTFKNERALLERFVSENAAHGNPLSGFTRKLVTKELLEMGASGEAVANLFGVSVNRVTRWCDNTVDVVFRGKSAPNPQPVKRGIAPGITMNKKDYEQHMKCDRGISITSQAEQLIRWIKKGWVDYDSDTSLASLEELYIVLGDLFEKRKVVNA